jgi:hypothetical protein
MRADITTSLKKLLYEMNRLSTDNLAKINMGMKNTAVKYIFIIGFI